VGLFENADYDPPDVAIAVHVRGLPARAARKSVRNLLCCREQHNFGPAVGGRCSVEILAFMNQVIAAYRGSELHAIVDNLSTHKPKNDRWLKQHPNVHFHFTPTRASWLSQVEIWFSILQGKSLNGASFTSVKQLRNHIDAFITDYNENAAPFIWTKSQVHQRRFKGRRISQL
jgi:transposase